MLALCSQQHSAEPAVGYAQLADNGHQRCKDVPTGVKPLSNQPILHTTQNQPTNLADDLKAITWTDHTIKRPSGRMFSVVDKANKLTDGPPTPQPRRKHWENRGNVMGVGAWGVGSPSAHSPSNPVNTRSNKPPLPPTQYSGTKIAKFPPGSIPLYQFLSIDHPTAPPWPLYHPLQANIKPKCAVDLYSLSLFWHCPLGFTAKDGCSGGCSLPIVLPWLQDTPLQGGGQRDCGSKRSEGMAGNPKWSGNPL